jgi:hypothetical protein
MSAELFRDACVSGDLQKAFNIVVDNLDNLTDIVLIFVELFENGSLDIICDLIVYDINIGFIIFEQIYILDHLDFTEWLCHKLSPSEILKCACLNGQLNVVKWILDKFKPNPTDAFMGSWFHLDCLKLLLSNYSELDVYSYNHYLIRGACAYNCKDTVIFLVENYYKFYPYIKLDDYARFESEIKDILINYNLIDPSTLTEPGLDYYLLKTNGVVPEDFVNKYNKPVKIRGQHTKPALRE